jgi:hypothetical protein
MGTTATALVGPAFRSKGLVVSLALALLVSVGTAIGAGAERPPSGGDSHQQACRALYDQAEKLRDEYKQVGTANPGSPRLDEIIAEGRNVGQTYQDLHCDDRYGSIAALVVSPYAPITDAEHEIVADPSQNIVSTEPEQAVAADPGYEIVADPSQVIADPGQAITADPAADPGQAIPVPADDAEIVVPVDESGEVGLADAAPALVADEQS